MVMKPVRIPAKLYRDCWEFKRQHMKREGEVIPLWKALVEVENNNRIRRFGKKNSREDTFL